MHVNATQAGANAMTLVRAEQIKADRDTYEAALRDAKAIYEQRVKQAADMEATAAKAGGAEQVKDFLGYLKSDFWAFEKVLKDGAQTPE